MTPKFAVYMSMTNNCYTPTYLTLQSLGTALQNQHTRLFFVADGTTDPKCLELFHSHAFKEKFGINQQTVKLIQFTQREGVAPCLNYVLQQLEPDEDLLIIPNTTIFERNFLEPLFRVAYQESYSQTVFCVSATPVGFPSHFQDIYDHFVTIPFLRGIEPNQGMEILQHFFKTSLQKSLQETLQNQIEQNQNQVIAGDLGTVCYFKSPCFHQVGFFDERCAYDSRGNPGGYGEEWDYSSRITQLEKLSLFAKDSTFWLLARGFSSGGESEISKQERQNRFNRKYSGELWVKMGTFLQRVLKVQEKQEYVIVGKYLYPQHHSIFEVRHANE